MQTISPLRRQSEAISASTIKDGIEIADDAANAINDGVNAVKNAIKGWKR